MSDHPGQLPVPPGSFGAGEAREVLRAWAVDGGLQVSMFDAEWERPTDLGVTAPVQ